MGNKHPVIDTPFFSIITASLNNEATVEKTILSIKNQTFHSVEHIIIDGGSTDKTVEIIRRYETLYNLSWISEPDRGIADALNKGIKRTTGKYVLVLQADDCLVDESVLGTIFMNLQDEHFDIYTGSIIQDTGTFRKVLSPAPLLWWYHFKTPFLHQASFVHKRVFDRIGVFLDDFKITMDYDFFYRALKSGVKVKKAPSVIVAVMMAGGLGGNRNYLEKRIREEFHVHNRNENRRIWRRVHKVYQFLYFRYKVKLRGS